MVANAGVGSTNTLDNLNVTGAEKVIRVNLLGVIYAIEAVLPQMLQRGTGHIAALSSLASYKGIPGAAAYCASKAAVNAYVESLRIQLHGTGVSSTTIRPGFIRTPMIEQNKGMFLILEPDAAARKIVRAIRRRSKVIDFPWLTSRLMKLTYWIPDWLLHRLMPVQVGGKEEN
jgi:short-subunit dehydrogenase